MYSKIISWTGNGDSQKFDLEFDACACLVFPESALIPVLHMPTRWSGRSNYLGALDSFGEGVRIIGRKLIVGANAAVNTIGVIYRAVVIGAQSGDVETPSWFGNATAGRKVRLRDVAQPVAAIIKRDSPLPAVIAAGDGTSVHADGTTSVYGNVAAGALTLTPASLTLSASAVVNEWAPAYESGEGIDAIVFGAGSVVVGSYTGTGTTQRINTGCVAAAVLAWKTAGGEVTYFAVAGARNKSAKSCDTGAIAESVLSIDQPGVLEVASATTLNASGVKYTYVVIPLNRPAQQPAAPSIIVKSKSALMLPGRGNQGLVDCGYGLNINGDITLRWVGATWHDSIQNRSPDTELTLLTKQASAMTNVDNTASWGMVLGRNNSSGGIDWSGPQLASFVNRRNWWGTPIGESNARTGVVLTQGVVHDVVFTASGDTFEWWVDGRLVKQRTGSGGGIVSNPAHKVSIGARWTGSTFTYSAKMLMLEASVYSRKLSDSEIVQLYERSKGSSVGEVTTGLAERWDAARVSGNTLIAEVNSSNNGAITGGFLLKL